MKQVAVTLLKLPSGQYVFQRRTKNAPVNAGLLGFFGGHIEDGEDSAQAVKRELAEETSLDTDQLSFIHLEDFIVDREGEDVRYFLYEVAIENIDFNVFEGDHAEAYDANEALERTDLTSSVKYVLEKISKEK